MSALEPGLDLCRSATVSASTQSKEGLGKSQQPMSLNEGPLLYELREDASQEFPRQLSDYMH